MDYSAKYGSCFGYREKGVCLLHDTFAFIVSSDQVDPAYCDFCRANHVDLSQRIIDPTPDFVHAVIRIGLLDFYNVNPMKLPPMNALKAFEAVSRLGSVSKAADELCVSQGAVSQQLRNLEDHLGREMFVRTPNSFTLSEDGEDFAEVVQHSLGEIAFAANKVKRGKKQRTLTLSIGLGVADKWLMPRLGEFHRLYPDVTIALDKNLSNVTFKNDGIDAAVRFGDGAFEGLESVFLFPCTKFAVASPHYISKHGLLDDLARPTGHLLIDCRRGSKDQDALCGLWEDVVDREYTNLEEQLTILPDDQQALNAAIHGRGIALAFNYQMRDEIEAGNIVYANREPVSFRGGFYFVSPTGVRPNSDLDAFRDWLVEISADYRSEENPA